MDEFVDIWDVQNTQQRVLGLDPELMDGTERRRVFSDFVQHMHEEVTALGLIAPAYKRHLLEGAELKCDGKNHAALEKCVDLQKMIFCVAQLLGFDHLSFIEAFLVKTNAVSERFRQDQARLKDGVKLFCFDIDDVAADLSAHLESKGLFARDLAADPAARLARSEAIRHDFHNSDAFRNLEPIHGAVKTLREIRERYGMMHVAVTARPQWQYKHLYSDTLYWLQKHGIPCDRVIFKRNKVEALFELRPAWPVAFVEDHVRNANELVEAGVDVLLFDRPHNRLPSAKGERVIGWDGVLAALERRIQSK
jgi:deoxypyrimidine-specific 5' nucleotidase type C protein (NT5C)